MWTIFIYILCSIVYVEKNCVQPYWEHISLWLSDPHCLNMIRSVSLTAQGHYADPILDTVGSICSSSLISITYSVFLSLSPHLDLITIPFPKLSFDKCNIHISLCVTESKHMVNWYLNANVMKIMEVPHSNMHCNPLHNFIKSISAFVDSPLVWH